MAPRTRSRLAGPAIMGCLGTMLALGTGAAIAVSAVEQRWLLIGWMVLLAIGVGFAGLGAITLVVRLAKGDRVERE